MSASNSLNLASALANWKVRAEGASQASYYLPGPAAILALLALACAVAIEVWALGFTITGLSTPFYLVVLPALGAFYASRRGMDGRMISAMTALAALCATCLLSAIIQYTATARGGVELIDHTLLAIDRALGFDWFAFVAFIDQSKLVSDLLLMCYMSIGVQMVAILVVFLYRQDYEGVDAYIIGLVILIGVACVVCAWLPAIGITGIVDVSFENTPVAGGRAGQPSFLDLRSGALRTVDLNWMNGLITFPSGHAAFAFMTTLAARRAPYAFWPFAVVNLLMIVSTLTHGGHYLCDLIAGGFLAAAAWWTGSRLATLPLNGVRKLVGMTARP